MIDPIHVAAYAAERQQRDRERAAADRLAAQVRRSRQAARSAHANPSITMDDVLADFGAGRERPLTIPAPLGPARSPLGGPRFLATLVAARVGLRLGLPSRALLDRLWFTPWVAGRTPPRPDGAGALEIPWTDGPLVGWQVGAGPVVLLVHGWGGRSTDLGAVATRLVDAGRRVVSVDLPAHGASPGTMTDIVAMAAAVRAVADRLGPLDGLVAHSAGALVALLAMADGLEVPRATLIAPLDTLDGAVGRFVRRTGIGPRGDRTLRSSLEATFGSDIWERLHGSQIAVRADAVVQVVHDVDDREVPIRDGLAVARAFGAEPVLTAGLGHGRILTDPDVARRVVDHFENAAVPTEVGAF